MQELLDIVRIVRSDKISPLKNFSDDNLESTKAQKLFEGIRDGLFTNDEDAARAIYDCEPSDKRYMMLRKYLADHLVQLLSSYDYSLLLSPTNNQLVECSRTLLSIRIMLMQSKRKTAGALTRKLLKKAEEYHLTEIRIQCLRILRGTASLQGDRKSFANYGKELEEVLILQHLELEAEEICQDIESNFTRTLIVSEDLAQMAEDRLKQFDEKRQGRSSFTLELNRMRIMTLIHSIRHEFELLLNTCNDALTWLSGYPKLSTKSRIAEFAVHAMNAALCLRRHEQAGPYARLCLESYTPGTHNWYLALFRLIQIMLTVGDYKSAADCYKLGVEDAGFARLDEFQKERWIVLGGYLSLFVPEKLLQQIKAKDKRISKALNKANVLPEIPEAVQGKDGLHVPIFILFILYLFENQETEIIPAQLRVLKKFFRRNHDPKSYPRTKTFLSMLQTFPTARYRIKTVKRMTEKYKKTLYTQPLLEELEILPYENLWAWLLKPYEIIKRVETRK